MQRHTLRPFIHMLMCVLAVLLAAVALRLKAEELNTASQIRSLLIDEAAKHHPVKIRAVVTFFDEALFSRFIQDGTAGIYLADSTNLPTKLNPGQVVEVVGETGPGEYAPVIVTKSISAVGMTNLPSPKRVNFEQLASGANDSQFVEISGIARVVNFVETTKYYVIEITTGGGRIVAYTKTLPTPKPENLIDSTIRVRGVCSTRFTRQRQLFAIRLMVPRPEDMQIEVAAPANPFASESKPIGSLLQFAPQGSYGHRVKVTGTVSYFDPGHVLYLQEGDQGLEVQTKQDTPLNIGDKIEVLGFPTQGDYTPLLQDAVYRKTSSGPAPEPALITHDDALKGAHDCRLVQISATLVDRAQHSSAPYLILQRDDFIFHAYLGVFHGYEPFAYLQNGSRVAVTGICRIEPGEWQAGEAWRAKSFKILMRSVDDVTILQPPPFWSLTKVLWVAAALAVATLLISFWVLALRRKVHEQTQIIRQRLKMEAALKERYQDLFENANDMVFTHKFNGDITSVNKSGERMLQKSRKDIVSRNVIDLIAEDQRPAAREWLEEIAKGVETPGTECDFLSADGQRVHLEISSRVIAQNDGGEVESIARDITERRQLERELSEISNREQRRIGHDLHDGVCQQLAAIAYHVDMLGDRLHEKQVPEAKETEVIAQMIKEANAQARGLARGLFPVRLHEQGLLHALSDLAANASKRYQIDCRFVSKVEPVKFHPEVELHLFFIAQEALINAVKHGESKQVTITLSQEKTGWKLMIEDNGKGMGSTDKNSSGMGVRIMRHRARVIGATLDLQSQNNRGTQITCLFNAQAINQTNA